MESFGVFEDGSSVKQRGFHTSPGDVNAIDELYLNHRHPDGQRGNLQVVIEDDPSSFLKIGIRMFLRNLSDEADEKWGYRAWWVTEVIRIPSWC